MANWFPMALKDGARSWRCANASSPTSKAPRPLAGRGRPAPHQAKTGETLQKYSQRFNNTRLKIPKVTDEAIISAFSDGVQDVKMKE